MIRHSLKRRFSAAASTLNGVTTPVPTFQTVQVSPNQIAKNPRPAPLVRPEHLNGFNPLRCSDQEWEHRCETAALCRALYLYGFGDDLAAQCVISKCKDTAGENFIYMHEWGMLFEEADASSMVKVDWSDQLVDNVTGSRTVGDASVINMGCTPVARAIFDSQPDVNFICHVHTETIMAVASTEVGLLPYSQAAMFLYGAIGRYPYNFRYETSFEDELAKSLEGKRGVMLDHHGCYTLGRTAAEAFFVAFHLRQACETQIKAMSMGTPLRQVSTEDLEEQYVEMMLSPDYAYDGSREWSGVVRKIKRDGHANFNL